MAEINHQVGIKASPNTVYKMLTTDKGLAQWWTNDVSGAGDVGSIIQFRFNEVFLHFEVSELIVNELVVWRHCCSVPEDWMGTDITFQLREENSQTFVRFTHSNWKEPSNFMGHCSTKWGIFMLSLKDAIENGIGRPFPNDIQIDHS